MTTKDLNVLLNAWPEGTVGWLQHESVIEELDKIGKAIGYGALSQLAGFMYQVQCNGDKEDAVTMKRSRFTGMRWDLPEGFEELAHTPRED